VNSLVKTPKSNTTIGQWLVGAVHQLQDAHIPTAQLDAEVILAHTINKPRTYLHAHPEEFIGLREIEIASARLDLRLDRVPVAYIIGHKDFYGHKFHVTTATLIPRPESEVMIELLREVVTKPAGKQLVDIGTGSGNLGITAKLLFPELTVSLLDSSRYALKIAEKNAESLKADVEIVWSDLLTSYPYKADYILANLPYVDEKWDRSVETNHEPASALFADQSGLSVIYRLLDTVYNYLSDSGFLFIEADPEQHDKIIEYGLKKRLLLHTQRDYQLVFQKI